MSEIKPTSIYIQFFNTIQEAQILEFMDSINRLVLYWNKYQKFPEILDGLQSLPKKQWRNRVSLNIRNSPSVSGKIVGVLPALSVVEELGIENGWIKIEKGYISKSYCEEVK